MSNLAPSRGKKIATFWQKITQSRLWTGQAFASRLSKRRPRIDDLRIMQPNPRAKDQTLTRQAGTQHCRAMNIVAGLPLLISPPLELYPKCAVRSSH